MLPPYGRSYVLTGISATPDVLEGFLLSLAPGDSLWDFRPDPERFTLREVVAHLADWEDVWLQRLGRTIHEDEPLLAWLDEGQIAVDRDYAHSDPHAGLARFRHGRQQVLELLGVAPESAWGRVARREQVGPMSFEDQVVLILAHDGYHNKQVVEWLSAGRPRR